MANLRQTPVAADQDQAVSTRNEIFMRAMKLFEEKGFRGTSMEEIAKVCGITKPAIYYHYKNKSDLLEALYIESTRDFYEPSYAIVESKQSPLAKLRTLLRRNVLYNIEHWTFQSVLLRDRRELSASTRKALAQRERAYEKAITKIIRDAQKAGELRSTSAEFATLTVLGLISSLPRWARHYQKSPNEIADGVVDLLVRGLTASK